MNDEPDTQALAGSLDAGVCTGIEGPLPLADEPPDPMVPPAALAAGGARLAGG